MADEAPSFIVRVKDHFPDDSDLFRLAPLNRSVSILFDIPEKCKEMVMVFFQSLDEWELS